MKPRVLATNDDGQTLAKVCIITQTFFDRRQLLRRQRFFKKSAELGVGGLNYDQ